MAWGDIWPEGWKWLWHLRNNLYKIDAEQKSFLLKSDVKHAPGVLYQPISSWNSHGKKPNSNQPSTWPFDIVHRKTHTVW